MQLIAFIVTWAIIGVGITLWLSSIGLGLILAVIIGIIGGLIVNGIAWAVCKDGIGPIGF